MPVFHKQKRQRRNWRRIAFYTLTTLIAAYLLVVTGILMTITDYDPAIPQDYMGLTIPENAENVQAFTLVLPPAQAMSYMRFDVPYETAMGFINVLCQKMQLRPETYLSDEPHSNIFNVFKPYWWTPDPAHNQGWHCRQPGKDFVKVWLDNHETGLVTVYIDAGFSSYQRMPWQGASRTIYLVR